MSKRDDADAHPRVRKSNNRNLLLVKATVGWRVVDGSFGRMRLINDYRGTGKKANTKYKQNGDIVTTRRVSADEEFLIDYGEGYWREYRHLLKRK